jgi:uncharacterized protein (DUF2147 family)
MSKRSNKTRQAKAAIPQAARRKFPCLAIFSLAVAVALSIGVWWWIARSAASNPEFKTLTGRWQRPDGGYVLAIKSIADNGAMDADYFNPKSIHIANAEASREGGAMKVFIELRDVNYPGSTYTLAYDLASDQLKGIYYQAVERQRFSVTFARVK